MPHVNELLSKCVVQHENDCLPSISELISQVEITIRKIELKASKLVKNLVRRCQVCGDGYYQLTADRDSQELPNLGLSPKYPNSFRVYACDMCGHVQLFATTIDQMPKAWID